MSYQYVNVVTINKVAVIEFNYGRKLNALSKVFIDDLMQALSDLNYSAAIFLIPICISFDTAEKRRYATYLILNRRFSFEF